jgi:hypothetical protein
MRCALVIAIVVGSAVPAHADSAEALETLGAKLAKEGLFAEAIDAFKDADRIAPRAGHACMIALAYTRREMWPQAEIFFDVCHRRASTNDPLPEWLPTAEKVLSDHLATANVAAIDIHVEPHDVPVRLTVSSFAHDETFSPRRIHVAFGEHVITATAPGYLPMSRPIVVTDKREQRVVLYMQPRPSAWRTVGPWAFVGAGAALGLAGAAVHVFLLEPVRNDLVRDATLGSLDRVDYDRKSHQFDVRRDLAITLYAAGGLAILTGFVLRETTHTEHVEVSARAGGAVVSWTWSLP